MLYLFHTFTLKVHVHVHQANIHVDKANLSYIQYIPGIYQVCHYYLCKPLDVSKVFV